MIKLYFKPADSDLPTILLTGQHKRLWQLHGENIINAFEKITAVKFTQGIRVKVGYLKGEDSNSYSGVTSVRAISLNYLKAQHNYQNDEKILAKLCHEIGHTLLDQHNLALDQYGLKSGSPKRTYEAHRDLYVFLIDVIYEAFESAQAAAVIDDENRLNSYLREDHEHPERISLYKAWEWAKALSPDQRHEFTELLFHKGMALLP